LTGAPLADDPEVQRILALSPPEIIQTLSDCASDGRILRLSKADLGRDLVRALGHRPEGKAWEAARPAPAHLASAMAYLLLHRELPRVAVRDAVTVGFVAESLTSDLRADFYAALGEEIRSRLADVELSEGDGLTYLFVAAADALFADRRRDEAETCNRLASDFTYYLPDSDKSDVARLRQVSQRINIAAYFPSDRLRMEFDDLVAALESELSRTADRAGIRPLRVARIRAALALSNLWKTAGDRRLRGVVTVSESRITILQRALLAAGFISQTGPEWLTDIHLAMSKMDRSEAGAVARALVEVAVCEVALGRFTQAALTGDVAAAFGLNHRSEQELKSALSRASWDPAVAVAHCETFLRVQFSDAFAAWTAASRETALRSHARVARELGNSLDRHGDRGAKWFWGRQAEYWTHEAESSRTQVDVAAYLKEQTPAARFAAYVATIGNHESQPDGDNDGGLERRQRRGRARARTRKKGAGVVSAASITGAAFAMQRNAELESADVPDPDVELRAIVEANIEARMSEFAALVAEERIGEVITTLTAVHQSRRSPSDGRLDPLFVDALNTLASWRPALVSDLVGARQSVSPPAGHDGMRPSRLLLVAAERLALAYAQQRLVPIYLFMSEVTGASRVERRTALLLARDRAREQARFADELRIEVRLLQLDSGQTGDLSIPAAERAEQAVQVQRLSREAVADSLAAIRDVLVRAKKSSSGIVSLTDRTASFAQLLVELAVLIGQEFPEEAFAVVTLLQGWTSAALTDSPVLVDDLMASLEATLSGVDPEQKSLAKQSYYCHVASKIIEGTPRADERPTDEVLTPLPAPCLGEAQMVLGQHKGKVWRAVRAQTDDLAPESSFELLEARVSDLSQLLDGVWVRSRNGVDVTALLRDLHRTLIARWWRDNIRHLTITFQGGVPFVPVHGALDAEGIHLGTRVAVRYAFANANPSEELAQEPLKSGVVGLDPTVLADVESSEVRSDLADRGLALLDGILDPVATRDLLILNPAVRLLVLHVAGHGDFRAFPASMQSTVALGEDVTVSAMDVAQSGCSARFAFLNVCEVGAQATHGGDAYGFPLAFRVRGARGVLAPSTFVAPSDARRFARLFYGAHHYSTASESIRQVNAGLVAKGAPVSAWLPYALWGDHEPLRSAGVDS
jgi:hypothetical protein